MDTGIYLLRVRRRPDALLFKWVDQDVVYPFGIPYRGNFEGANFRGMAREAPRFFCSCNIKKPLPPQALHVKYRCVGAV